jgi:hypothetical protein
MAEENEISFEDYPMEENVCSDLKHYYAPICCTTNKRKKDLSVIKLQLKKFLTDNNLMEKEFSAYYVDHITFTGVFAEYFSEEKEGESIRVFFHVNQPESWDSLKGKDLLKVEDFEKLTFEHTVGWGCESCNAAI